MAQNLRLGSGAKSYTLTPADSNISSNFVLPIAQTGGDASWSDASNSSNAKHVYATGDTDYGNFYNWYTATAGTGLGTMKSSSATNLTNASSSICPKGWRLPDGGQSVTKSFYQLDKSLGGSGSNRNDATQRNKYLASPFSFVYSGHYHYEGVIRVQSSRGYWWSRSAHTTSGLAYGFSLASDSYVAPQYSSSVGHGFAVRCISE